MFEAWSVAIKIRLIDEVGSGLLGMVGRFRSANMEASALEKRIEGIRRTMLVGVGLTAAGVGILATFKPALEEARQIPSPRRRSSRRPASATR